MRAALLALLAVGALAGCGVEPLLGHLATGEGLPVLPDVQPNFLEGTAEDGAGTTVALVQAGGQPLEGFETQAGADGAFSFELPGTQDFVGLRVWTRRGERTALALAPAIARKRTVRDPAATYALSQVPGMDPVGTRSTTLALVVLAASKGASLVAADGTDLLPQAAGAALDALQGQGEALVQLEALVEALRAAASEDAEGDGPFDPAYGGAPGSSALRAGFLASHDVDLDGDGAPDRDPAAFDAALAAAAAALSLETCTPRGWMRVVFEVALWPQAVDQNCSPIDPFKWTADSPGKQVFITGGLLTEEDGTPVCGAQRATWCVPEPTVEAVNEVLGNWVPNRVPMYDDGTHGDAVAGDHVYTRTFILPYVPTAQSPDGRGVRLAYKYTYGAPGQGWTDAEEWPGNRRLLEVEDVNGDGLVVRFDFFGDETSNKDKSNLLTPAHGGCGVNHWQSEAVEHCQADTRENPTVDLDGDCVAAEQTPAPAAGPATCPEVEALGLDPPVWDAAPGAAR